MRKHLTRIQDVNRIEVMRKVEMELRQGGKGLKQGGRELRAIEIEVGREQMTVEKGFARVAMELKRAHSRPTQEMWLLQPPIHLDDCPQKEDHSEEKSSME